MIYRNQINREIIVEAFQVPFDLTIYVNGTIGRAYRGDWIVKYPKDITIIGDNTFTKYFQLVDGPINE